MMVEEATRLGIRLEMPEGDECPFCLSPWFGCGTRQSARSILGKSVFRSSLCMSRGEARVLDQFQKWRKEEENNGS